MPYYAYVNGKATIGLETVEQIKEYVDKQFAHYKQAEVNILDMEWTREGQKVVSQYTLNYGRKTSEVVIPQ